MFGNKKTEIEKVFEKYGISKGSQFLKYACTFLIHTDELENQGINSQPFATKIIRLIQKTHGDDYLDEYTAFFRSTLKNAKLVDELHRSKDKYYDKALCRPQKEEKSHSSQPTTDISQKQQETTVRKVSESIVSDTNALGRNESRHISCEYSGREDLCPKECSSCAISIKTDGDLSLSSGNLDNAIELYLQALDMEPRFAEAWCNLADAYGMKREYDEALTAFDKAISIDPRYGKALFGKAITLKNLERKEEALEFARIVNELYPGNSNVISFLNGLDYQAAAPKLPQKKPIVVPPISLPKPPFTTQVSSVNKCSPDEWYKHCTYEVSLWEIVDGKPTKKVGTLANTINLPDKAFYTPLLNIENHSGCDASQFTITCKIDGVKKSNWTVKELHDGSTQRAWLGESNELSLSLIGIHTAEYYVDEYKVYKFSWCITNPKNDWIFRLSSESTLYLYDANNTKGGYVGLDVVLQDIPKNKYVSPVITLRNNADEDTPSFTLNCLIDGKNSFMWENCSIKRNSITGRKLGESSINPFMTKGRHIIVYSILGCVVGEFEWTVK